MSRIAVSAINNQATPELDLIRRQQAAIRKATKKVGRLVEKRARVLVPQPGYPGDDPDLIALRYTLTTVVKQGRTIYGLVGPKRQGGQHGLLVEGAYSGGLIDVRHHSHGEPTGTILKKSAFLYGAAASTLEQQKQVMHADLRAIRSG